MQSTGNGRLPARRRSRRTTQGLRRAGGQPAAGSSDRSRWNDIYTSGAVILAGVIVVIGFGFVASRAINGDDDAGQLPEPPPPAALGNATTPPADQGAIELGSPTPTPSSSPTPSPSKSTSRPAPPPDQGAIRIETGSVPSTVTLSSQGTRDWVHWGQEGTFALERDRDGGFAILEGTPSAPRFRHALSPQRFAWTGGDPVASSDGTTTGIRTCGAGNGFTITAPAGTQTRTLRLYVGVVSGRGRLEASLTAGNASRSVTLEQRDGDFRSALYTLTYRAPKTAKLQLKWVTQAAFGDGCGGVALEAATLR
ncbi:hypothetical protein [Paractinoplanes rishiriensis]|uniref:Uncharacterized protein n=1 Tax=Paractinoplanes rishiriensis TaxID=1050105 RepID=A0A919K1V5_9ACTN|nr:hypothetical protein [Actinoplanes rishiriensis]GIE97294.1 hypothetical protein Ari01nite_47590 [Actinoplanes rishiriensis]